jgi:hypothetical protein
MTYLMLLSARWSKSTDALDAALCSLGVFSVLRRTAAPVTAGTFSKWIVLAVLARIKGLTVGRQRAILMTQQVNRKYLSERLKLAPRELCEARSGKNHICVPDAPAL